MRERVRYRIGQRETGRAGCTGCGGCGCLIFTAGAILTLIGAAVGVGGVGKIPYTESKFMFGGSLGDRNRTREAVPWYIQDRSLQMDNPAGEVSQSGAFRFWRLEGLEVISLGNGLRAPDYNLEIRLASQ